MLIPGPLNSAHKPTQQEEQQQQQQKKSESFQSLEWAFKTARQIFSHHLPTSSGASEGAAAAILALLLGVVLSRGAPNLAL